MLSSKELPRDNNFKLDAGADKLVIHVHLPFHKISGGQWVESEK